MQRGGPLAEFADGYRDELLRQGSTANSVVTHVVLMGQLSRWRAAAGVAVEDLTPTRIEEFLDSRRAGGQRRVPMTRVLDPLLASCRLPGWWARRWLTRRGRWGICLSAMSVTWWKTGAWPLRRSWAMSKLPGGSCPSVRRLRETRPASLAYAEAWSSRSCCGSVSGSRLAPKNRVTGLRSVLRFLRLESLVAADLAAAVPPVPGWRDLGCRLCRPGSTSPLSWRAVTGRGPPGCVITRSCCCRPALACGRAR